MPPSFAGKMRRKLQAGAQVENLRARCPYFYTVAEQFNGMITSEDIPTFVTATFTQRYKVSTTAGSCPWSPRTPCSPFSPAAAPRPVR